MPAGRLPVKAKTSRQRAGLDSEPPGQREQTGVSRPLGGSPHFSPLEVSTWLVLPIVPLLFGSLIPRLSAGSSAPGAASASASPAPSGRCSRLLLMLAQSVPGWRVIWLRPVSAPSAGRWFASSNARPAEGEKKRAARAALPCLDTIRNNCEPVTARKRSDGAGKRRI